MPDIPELQLEDQQSHTLILLLSLFLYITGLVGIFLLTRGEMAQWIISTVAFSILFMFIMTFVEVKFTSITPILRISFVSILFFAVTVGAFANIRTENKPPVNNDSQLLAQTVPETTSTVPETTSTVPETTSTVPETTSTVPETTSTVPETTSTVPETTTTKKPSTNQPKNNSNNNSSNQEIPPLSVPTNVPASPPRTTPSPPKASPPKTTPKPPKTTPKPPKASPPKTIPKPPKAEPKPVIKTLYIGTFKPVDAEGSGKVKITEEDGQLKLTLNDVKVNKNNLTVSLSDDAKGTDQIELGSFNSNSENQRFNLPDVSFNVYKRVILYSQSENIVALSAFLDPVK